MAELKPIKFNDFHKFLLSEGCELNRVRGDHYIYTKPDLLRPLVVPYRKELSKAILRSNLKTLGISTEEFIDKIGVRR